MQGVIEVVIAWLVDWVITGKQVGDGVGASPVELPFRLKTMCMLVICGLEVLQAELQ